MRIPEIRVRLEELADQYNLPELVVLARELRRRVPNSRASKHSLSMNDTVREQIKAIRLAEPDLPLHRIAVALNVNPGRVSETLKGFRV
jgi:hypothetical protein